MTVVTGRFFLALAGWALFDFWGALFGFLFGWWLDHHLRKHLWTNKRHHTASQYYLHALFALMGRLAKADGHVSPEEIQWASSQMKMLGLSETLVEQAKQWFRDGRDTNDLSPIIRMARKHLTRAQRRQLIQQLATLFETVGNHGTQQALWQHIAQQLGLSVKQTHKILAKTLRNRMLTTLAMAYQTLEISPDCNDAEVKRAYRRKMMQLHPDRHFARHANAEDLSHTTEQMKRVQEAYRTIRESRTKQAAKNLDP